MTDEPRECADPWHQDPDAPHETYEVERVPGQPWRTFGYRCPTCGEGTVIGETYIPMTKPCPRCARVFEGLPDQPDEICDDCSMVAVAAYIAALKDPGAP